MDIVRVGNYRFNKGFLSSIRLELEAMKTCFQVSEDMKLGETFSYKLRLNTSESNFQKKLFSSKYSSFDQKRVIEISVFAVELDLVSLKDVIPKYGSCFASHGKDEELAEFIKQMKIQPTEMFIVVDKNLPRLNSSYFNFVTSHEIGHILLGHFAKLAREEAAKKVVDEILGLDIKPISLVDPYDQKEFEADLFGAHVCGQKAFVKAFENFAEFILRASKDVTTISPADLKKAIQQLRNRISQVKYYFPGTH